jgi:hypothetical protein
VNHYRPVSEHSGRPEFSDAEPTGLSQTDALFAMLDGQIIRGRKAAWRAEVVAIHAEPEQTWIEIGPARRPTKAVMVRLGADRQADRALEALRAWTDLPEERRPGRIDVA